MDAVASVIITQKFNDEDVIIREGDPGSSFYVIKEVRYIVYLLRETNAC